MLTHFLTVLLLAAVFSIALMVVIWRAGVRIRNFGIVDIAWSASFSVLAVIYGVLSNGYGPRRVLITAMAALWSLRLGTHLYFRVMKHHPVEDCRYAKLREEWGTDTNRKMFWFFQLQAGSQVMLSAPFLLVCFNPQLGLGLIEWLGFAVWLIALAGESLADHQLKQFKTDPANQSRVCKAGLWRYSRHPNYFFEWLIWVAFFVFALGSPWGWTTIYGPLLMLQFLLKVTGIPMTEELAVKTKGEAYREYQRTTSSFVPWFTRRDS